jgi:aminoglycoside phosphotransferase family enzyme/predicted kinase
MTDTLHKLIEALQQPALFPHPVTRFEVIETHISIVLLTGSYAYKFKKPVNFGFLDFSTLAKRKHFCEEELRLNRRLAPELYLEVVPVSTGPKLGGDGEVIEYAVRMREFEQASQFDRMLDAGQLEAGHIEALGLRIAKFHTAAAIAGPDSAYGTPSAIQAPVDENFSQILNCIHESQEQPHLESLRNWTHEASRKLQSTLQARKDNGFIRECHGDLHLRNIALIDDIPVAFDCIEFNDNLRWIDIISEVAFMVMDLDHRRQAGLASRFLNVWLEQIGDYAGVSLLRYYLVYRAMVRAKVDCLRAHQTDIDAATREATLKEYRAYLALAERYTKPPPPVLLLMHGLSGSGKTRVSQSLLEKLPAIRLRSDIERKRLHGLAADAQTGSGIDQGIYDRTASENVYRHLQSLAGTLLDAGHNVIVDATFLQQNRLVPFIELADTRSTHCFIIDCQAPESELRKRIAARERDRHDASEAGIKVLEKQLHHYQPLGTSVAGAEVLVTHSDTPAITRLLELLRKQGV